MKNKYVILVWLLLILLPSCHTSGTKEQSAPRIIFDTDMGNDIDDALALTMLNNYMSEGKLHLMGVILSKKNPYSVEYVDILNTWYGHPGIPLGMTLKNRGPQDPTYAKAVAELKENGKKVFQGTLPGYREIPGAVSLYRKLLARSPDTSLIIICVGFSTNLSDLLNSGPDAFSSRNGTDLIRQKVKYLSMMAANFDGIIQNREFNVVNDCDAARDVFDHWPTKIIISPFEVGIQVKYPASSIEHDFGKEKHHPLAEAYKSFMKMPYDRPCWDPTSVLYVMEKDSGYFTLSDPGYVKTDTACATFFVPEKDAKCQVLKIDSIQAKKITHRLVEVVTASEKSSIKK
ncbi:MAG: nucleoside hydrolase [Bacteroidales bacterium]|nr:nucleoside hydrolase [Bacteroidales bacterium]